MKYARNNGLAMVCVLGAFGAGCDGALNEGTNQDSSDVYRAEVGEATDSVAFSGRLQATLEDSKDLLARVALAKDRALEMYGLDGVVVIAETGLYGSAPSALSDAEKELDPVAFYRKIAPAEPVPARLTRYMQALQDGLKPALADVPAHDKALAYFEDYSNTGFGPPNTCPLSWFINQKGFYGAFCPSGFDPYDRWCKGGLTSSTRDYQNINTHESTATLCVDSGSSPWTILTNWTGEHKFTQKAGTWRQVRIAGGSSWFTKNNIALKYTVGTGRTFQYGGYVISW
jgi:hypothetical protein